MYSLSSERNANISLPTLPVINQQHGSQAEFVQDHSNIKQNVQEFNNDPYIQLSGSVSVNKGMVLPKLLNDTYNNKQDKLKTIHPHWLEIDANNSLNAMNINSWNDTFELKLLVQLKLDSHGMKMDYSLERSLEQWIKLKQKLQASKVLYTSSQKEIKQSGQN